MGREKSEGVYIDVQDMGYYYFTDVNEYFEYAFNFSDYYNCVTSI